MRWTIVLTDSPDYSIDGYDRLITLNHDPRCYGDPLSEYVLKNNAKLGNALSQGLRRLSSLTNENDLKTVASILSIEGELCFWHLSGASERCIVRNPSLEDYYIYISVLEYIGELEVDSISIIGGSTLIANQLLKRFPDATLLHNGKKVNSKHLSKSAFSTVDASKKYLAAVFALIKLFYSLLVIRNYSVSEMQKEGDLSFICYSDNISVDRKGRFESTYFRDIVKTLHDSRKKVCWYHLFDSSRGLSPNTIVNQLRAQEKGDDFQVLRLLDGYSSLTNFFTVISVYLKLQKSGRKVEKIFDLKDQEETSPWPFISDSWRRSISGGSSIKLINQIVLLKYVVKNSTIDKPCFFLCEGMVWERALLYFWRKYKSAPIYGCIHSSIKSLDFRLNFYGIDDDRYRPDFFLYPLNTNTKRLSDFGLPASKIKKMAPMSDRKFTTRQNFQVTNRSEELIGIVLDGIVEIDSWIVGMLESLIEITELRGKRFVLKPHPNVPFLLSERSQGGINFEVVDYGLVELLERCSVVLCSISSSAAIEVEKHAEHVGFFQRPSHLIRTPLDYIHANSIITDVSTLRNAIFGNDRNKVSDDVVEVQRKDDGLDWGVFIN